MGKEKRKQNMNDVTKKEGINELSDESLESASGGTVYHETQDNIWGDLFGAKTYRVWFKDGNYLYSSTFKSKKKAIEFDKQKGGNGEVIER